MKTCPNCKGTGELLTECCNGNNCSCRGETVNLGHCRVCNGSGQVEENNYDPQANSKFIRRLGCGYLGSSLNGEKRLGE